MRPRATEGRDLVGGGGGRRMLLVGRRDLSLGGREEDGGGGGRLQVSRRKETRLTRQGHLGPAEHDDVGSGLRRIHFRD